MLNWRIDALRPQPPGFHLWWLIAFGHRQTLRFCIQIKVLWAGTHKHKGLESLCGFHLREACVSCSLSSYSHQVLVLHMYVLSYLVLFKSSVASTESKKLPVYLNIPTFLDLCCLWPTRILRAARLPNLCLVALELAAPPASPA